MSLFSNRMVAFTLAALLGACGASRSSPATQGTIKAFDASKSDPKAVAIADQVMAAVGGDANWAKVKQVEWTQGIIVDGELKDVSRHAWDRWNGRHQYARLDPSGNWGVTMHELFSNVSFAFVETKKGRQKQMQSDKENMVKEAQRRFDVDSYRLFLPYKLKDPGVHLAYAQELPEDGSPKGSPMKYDEIKVTFDPGVGPGAGDTWYLIVDKATHMPKIIEHVLAGKPDTERAGIELEDWTEAGGLKFPGKQTTLGYTKKDAPKVPVTFPPEWKDDVPFKDLQAPKPGEILVLTNVKVATSVNEDLFVPNVLE